MLVLWLDILSQFWIEYDFVVYPHLTFQVSQGSAAATDLRWGKNFNKFIFRNSLLYIIAVKKITKIGQYLPELTKINVSRFYGPRCRSFQWDFCFAVYGVEVWPMYVTHSDIRPLQRRAIFYN